MRRPLLRSGSLMRNRLNGADLRTGTSAAERGSVTPGALLVGHDAAPYQIGMAARGGPSPPGGRFARSSAGASRTTSPSYRPPGKGWRSSDVTDWPAAAPAAAEPPRHHRR